MLPITYNFSLVALSVLIAFMASYTTLDLAGRIAALGQGRYRSVWLVGGACAMGLGIWSMHFVGMLALSLSIPLGYDWAITAGSLVVAILVSYFALDLVSGPSLSPTKLIGGGVLMGVGIAGMHYAGMAAMRMAPVVVYNWWLVLFSVAIAVLASTAALWIAAILRDSPSRLRGLGRVGAAWVMGLAIAGMHYTGMAAVSFPLGTICGAASGLSANWLAVTVAIMTSNILVITLVLSLLDARLQLRTDDYTASLEGAHARLAYQTSHDALSGLPNRLMLTSLIEQSIDTCARAGTRFAVYFIDIDGFKSINDSMGHAMGDRVLGELAGRLRRAVREADVVARFGGDEFVVLVDELTSNMAGITMADQVAEQLLGCFDADFGLLDTSMTISASIGVSLYPDDGETMEDLLKHADAAMHAVKSGGRNDYRFFEAAMNVAGLRAMQIRRELRHAIDNDQLFIHYQPKFACGSTIIVGAEALVRWRHPVFGLISPAEFIPVAEQSGQIMPIGRWVIERVCMQLDAWQRTGLLTVKIAVNLSQYQLRSATLVEEIVATAARYGLAPCSLMFEITESIAMQNPAETMRTILKLQLAGFDMAIDDFGTGYSSLSYLQQFSVRQLKVDRMFVDGLGSHATKGASVVAAIINLAHSLDMEVVAEGVETTEQLAVLAAMGCDQIQGFLLARPLDSQVFIDLVNPHTAPIPA